MLNRWIIINYYSIAWAIDISGIGPVMPVDIGDRTGTVCHMIVPEMVMAVANIVIRIIIIFMITTEVTADMLVQGIIIIPVDNTCVAMIINVQFKE